MKNFTVDFSDLIETLKDNKMIDEDGYKKAKTINNQYINLSKDIANNLDIYVKNIIKILKSDYNIVVDYDYTKAFISGKIKKCGMDISKIDFNSIIKEFVKTINKDIKSKKNKKVSDIIKYKIENNDILINKFRYIDDINDFIKWLDITLIDNDITKKYYRSDDSISAIIELYDKCFKEKAEADDVILDVIKNVVTDKEYLEPFKQYVYNTEEVYNKLFALTNTKYRSELLFEIKNDYQSFLYRLLLNAEDNDSDLDHNYSFDDININVTLYDNSELTIVPRLLASPNGQDDIKHISFLLPGYSLNKDISIVYNNEKCTYTIQPVSGFTSVHNLKFKIELVVSNKYEILKKDNISLINGIFNITLRKNENTNNIII
jgi:hypothetical protein